MEFKSVETLGSYLREHRKRIGLTQAEAAALANVGLRFIIELENGKTTASFGKILQLTQSYGLSFTIQKKSGGANR